MDAKFELCSKQYQIFRTVGQHLLLGPRNEGDNSDNPKHGEESITIESPKVFNDPESQSLSSVTETEGDVLYVSTFSFASDEIFQDYPCCVLGEMRGTEIWQGVVKWRRCGLHCSSFS